MEDKPLTDEELREWAHEAWPNWPRFVRAARELLDARENIESLEIRAEKAETANLVLREVLSVVSRYEGGFRGLVDTALASQSLGGASLGRT